MTEIASARINTFGPSPKADSVLPSEEPVFILTSSQLQEIITKAILEATEPLYRELAYDRQRIAKLEQKEPQPLQKDRAEILKSLIVAHQGSMLAKDARKLMHLSKQSFTNLLATMDDDIDSKPSRLDKRQKVLTLK